MLLVGLSHLVVTLYLLAALALLLYGLNCYVMVLLFGSKNREAAERRRRIRNRYPGLGTMESLPTVTTQIAVYNEINVIERVIRAVALMKYPCRRTFVRDLPSSSAK